MKRSLLLSLLFVLPLGISPFSLQAQQVQIQKGQAQKTQAQKAHYHRGQTQPSLTTSKPASATPKQKEAAPEPTPTPAPAPKPVAKSSSMPEDQKPSYSLGLFMGEQIRMSLQAQGIDIHKGAFTKGLTDGATGAKPVLATDEAQYNLELLQQTAQGNIDSKVRNMAVAHSDQLFGPQQTIVAGNPQGTVTLVEFYDYECPHCKKMGPVIEELIENNPNLRVVYRPFPIINTNSTNAAVAAFAAMQQNRFEDLNNAFLATQRPLTDDEIRKIVRLTPKMDIKKYEIAIKGTRIKEELKNNRDLGLSIQLLGTPSFLIAKTVVDVEDKQTWPDANQIYFASGEVAPASLVELINKVGG